MDGSVFLLLGMIIGVIIVRLQDAGFIYPYKKRINREHLMSYQQWCSRHSEYSGASDGDKVDLYLIENK